MSNNIGQTVKNHPSINGFLNVYKPSGPTSMDVVRVIKRLTGQRKRVGHGGTLDPLAEGVLPICLGQATRLMEYLVDSKKHYQMEVRLGVTTSTYDAEGEVIKEGDPAGLSIEQIEEATKRFEGIVFQTPPMYSAIKIDGKRLYKLARSGINVERAPRKVEIPRIEILEFTPGSLVLKVESGRGAYMRSLAHDIGEALGCGGYLIKLVRLSSGPFKVEDAILVDRFQNADGQVSVEDFVQPVDCVLLDMKCATVSNTAERYIRTGQPVNLSDEIGPSARYMELYRLYTQDGRFLAVVRFDKAKNQWKPTRVFQLEAPSPFARM